MWVILLWACAPDDTAPSSADPPRARLEVSPTELELYPVDVGIDPPSSDVVLLENKGERTIQIHDLELLGSEVFSVVPMDPWDLVLEPGQSAEVVVRFDPTTAHRRYGLLQVHSDAPGTHEVKLHGLGMAPVAEAEPVSFGTPYIGCQTPASLVLHNTGNRDLHLDSVELLDGEGSLELGCVELPEVVEPRELVALPLVFTPLDSWPQQGVAVLHTNDPSMPELWVPLRGRGEVYGEGVDTWSTHELSGRDILFTLDRSAGFEDYSHTALANLLSLFEELKATHRLDFHLALTVADDGCILGDDPWIDSSFSASQAQEALAAMADLTFSNSTYGANSERGFSLAEAALKSANVGPGGCNDGFYRQNAELDIVSITDEPEQSVNPYTYYVSLFQSMKSRPDEVTLSAVAGDYPSGCGSASAGTGYYEGTVATGGVFASICAVDWYTRFERLWAGIPEVSLKYELDGLPVPATIEVWVDGVRVSSGWEYDATINSVVFEQGQEPAGGSEVEIRYQLMPDCE